MAAGSLIAGPLHLMPKLLDKVGSIPVAWLSSRQSLGIVERGADVSGLSVEADERREDDTLSRHDDRCRAGGALSMSITVAWRTHDPVHGRPTLPIDRGGQGRSGAERWKSAS